MKNVTLVPKIMDLSKQRYTLKTENYTSLHQRLTATSVDVIHET